MNEKRQQTVLRGARNSRTCERELEENIQRYLDALETADRTQPVELQTKTDRLHDTGRKKEMP